MISEKDQLKKLSIADLVCVTGGKGHIFYALEDKKPRYFMVNWKTQKVVSVKNPSLARKRGATDGLVRYEGLEEAIKAAEEELRLDSHPFDFLSQSASEESDGAAAFLLGYDIPTIDTFFTGSLPDGMC